MKTIVSHENEHVFMFLLEFFGEVFLEFGETTNKYSFQEFVEGKAHKEFVCFEDIEVHIEFSKMQALLLCNNTRVTAWHSLLGMF